MLYQALSSQTLSKLSAASLIEMLDELDAVDQGVQMGEIEESARTGTAEGVSGLLALPSPITLAAARTFWDERASEARTLPVAGQSAFVMMNGRVSLIIVMRGRSCYVTDMLD